MYENSGNIARDRLKYLILKDRVSCTNETIDMIKYDVLKTISNYIDVDNINSQIFIEQNDNKPLLIFKVPIK